MREKPTSKNILIALVSCIFVLVASYFAIQTFSSAWKQTEGNILPSPGYATISLLLLTAGQVFLAQGWVTLFPEVSNKNKLARTIHLSQLGKYIPGGISQPAAHVALAKTTGIPVQKAFTHYILFSIGLAIAGFSFGLPYAILASEGTLILRIGAALVSLVLLLLHRNISQKILTFLWKLLKRESAPTAIAQKKIFHVFGWLTLFMASHATAFFLLLSNNLETGRSISIAFSYGLAFTIGLLAIPFPSGAVVREAAFVLLLPWIAGNILIAIAIVHRLFVIAAEGAVLLGNSLRGLWQKRKLTEQKFNRKTDRTHTFVEHSGY